MMSRAGSPVRQFKTHNMNKYILIAAVCIYLAAGCTSNSLLPLSIEFDNIAGDQNLQLHTGSYRNASGETFSITLLQYYISNIQLTNTKGVTYTVPQDSSYFLIKEQNPDSRFAKIHVPPGEYTRLSFTLGIDSLRNTMDISKRTGILDPSGGMDAMYWDWNSGYIFFMMEGTSFAVPATIDRNQKFRFHIGGFGGYKTPGLNNLKTITLNLREAGTAIVKQGGQSNIHLMVDILKVFDGPDPVRLIDHSQVMFGEFSTRIANNYSTMFYHDHTEN